MEAVIPCLESEEFLIAAGRIGAERCRIPKHFNQSNIQDFRYLELISLKLTEHLPIRLGNDLLLLALCQPCTYSDANIPRRG